MERPEVCPCTKRGCPRHGDCAACEAFHLSGRRPPFCERAGEARGRERHRGKA